MARERSSRRRQPAGRAAQQRSSSNWLYLLLGGMGLIAVALVLLAVLNRPATSSPVSTEASTSASDIPYPEVARIPPAETKTKAEQGEAVFVDVRTTEEYASSHPQGAISIPLSELDTRYQELPQDKEIITICA